jgi:AcrR family transcriptional regulator
VNDGSGILAGMPHRSTTAPRAPTATRRSQSERREETRAKLLEATLQSLLDVGYAATTTRRVAELAGVSQGAQTHHFPHRVDLVAAAVEYLAERRIAELHKLVAGLPAAPEERIPQLLDVMWADFSGSIFTIFVELWVVARHDDELHERMVPVERRLARATAELARGIAGDAVARADWEERMLLTLGAIRGLALTRSFVPGGDALRDPWPIVRPLLIGMLVDAPR